MLSVEKALDQYYREHVALRCVDRRRAEFAMEALNRFFAKQPIEAIDIPACRAYAAARGVSSSTVRRELGVLRTAAQHAVKWKRLTPDKMPYIELPEEAENPRVWFYKDELAKLLGYAERADEKVFRFCQLAYHTGSRRAAIERLEWSQVDIANRRINLAKAGEQKTKKRRPIVSVSAAIAEELEKMHAVAKTEWVLGDPTPVYGRFIRAAERAGVLSLPARGLRQAGDATPHSLRHSRATHLLQDGKDPWGVANLLGDTLQTTLRVYGHACPEYMDSVVA